MITTTTDFATRTDRSAYAGSDGFQLGYLAPGGATKLAGVVDAGSVLRFLREP